MTDPVHLVAATAGFLALTLIWLGMLAGIGVRIGWSWQWIRHQTRYALHHTLIMTGLTLAAVHGVSQLARPGGEVSLLNVLVPFTARVDPVGLGLGTLALELMLCLAASILVVRRIGHRRWRSLHLGAYLVFTAACWHVVLSGSDVGTVVGTLIVLAWISTLAGWAWSTPWLRDAVTTRLGVEPDRSLSIEVDVRRCLRFGFCVHEAPDLFQLESDGQLRYVAKPATAELDAAVRAAAACPARAIVVAGEPTPVILPAPGIGAIDADSVR